MEELREACKAFFDKSPQAVGVARILVDENGEPYDFYYEYLNQSMANVSGARIEDLTGINAYEYWGDDDMSWLSHFADAALHGIACEFETVAILFEQFHHVYVAPFLPGYCTFVIQDVTDWVDKDPSIDDDLAVGLFYLDLRTFSLMLSTKTKERFGFEKRYIPASALAEKLFKPIDAAVLQEQMERLPHEARNIHFEGRSPDGRWYRLNSSPIVQSERFALGLIEDVTGLKEAEERSAHRMDVIESLTRENYALYVIDLEHAHVDVYSQAEDMLGDGFVRSIVDDDHEEERERYLQNVVVPEDRDQVSAAISREALKGFFASGESEMTVTFRRFINDEERHVEVRIIALAGHPRTAVLAVRNTHAEMEEQLRQKQALQKALELAQHASAAKSTFLTNMSHDFRTPMNSIVGFTDLALEHADDPARMVDCLQKIKRSSNHLLTLINDVLDVSRIESGVIDLDEKELDLAEMARDMEEIFSGEAQRKSIAFQVDTSGMQRSRVIADKQHIGQILVNRIGNAFKFTSADGSVIVRFSEFSEAQAGYGAHVPAGYGRFEFVVKDTGCGMVPEFLERLFVPYERDGLGKVNATEGTGLGMPITKNLIELLGGTIDVKSEVGRGSEFIVTLPLRLADDEERSSSGVDREGSHVDGASCTARQAQPAISRDCFAGKRILIADDDDLSREILKEILGAVGFSVDEARDGAEALERASASGESYYDAMLMDMRMPRMSGDEAARAIRETGRDDLCRVPIIALTADAFEEGRKRSHEAGMVAHITKPFKKEELMELLAHHIQ